MFAKTNPATCGDESLDVSKLTILPEDPVFAWFCRDRLDAAP
ncbi:hypothetical protein RRSWK_02980 [Rhodopirellula sp. SWK7]|nr:hypothetical protein RRSWK_02980 [Rhodopirellula sp. SWK7]